VADQEDEESAFIADKINIAKLLYLPKPYFSAMNAEN